MMPYCVWFLLATRRHPSECRLIGGNGLTNLPEGIFDNLEVLKTL